MSSNYGPTVEESDPELAALLKSLDQPDEPPKNVGPPSAVKPGEKPPKRSRRKASSRPVSKTTLEGKLNEVFMLMGMGLGAMGDEHCMTVVTKNGPAMARSLDKLAADNPSVKKALEATLETSAWVGVIMTVGPTLYGIAEHHLFTGDKETEEAAEQPREASVNAERFTEQPEEIDTGGVTLAWPTTKGSE